MYSFIFRSDGAFNGNIFKHTKNILKKHNSKLNMELFSSPESLALYLYEIMSPITNIKKSPKCLECENHTKFLGYMRGFSKFCSTRCSSQNGELKQQRILTNREKYGCDNPLQNDAIKRKLKQSNLEKYGVENVFQLSVVKDKIKEYNRAKYNCDYFTQTPEMKEKSKESSKEKYGVEFYQRLSFDNSKDFNREFILNISKDNIITPEIRFFLFNYFKASNYSNFIKSLENLGFIVQKYQAVSKGELELREALKEYINVPMIFNARNIIKGAKKYPLELDVYIPSMKLAFEYNGSYFHKSYKYFNNLTLEEYKSLECEKIGITLHHIWDYEDLSSRLNKIFKGD